jgi:molybdopterin-guanine dinucleotide biosynthesis protein A
VARRELTGVLLVGGASTRFGSPKAVAELDGETLADRGWRLLGELCNERIAVGKAADALPLAFPVLDDGSEVRAPLAGLVSALREATHDVCVVLPVDCPLVTVELLGELVDACADDVDVAVPQTGPLPGVYRRRALPVFEDALAAGRLSLRDALQELRVDVVDCDTDLLANVNTPEELARLR